MIIIRWLIGSGALLLTAYIVPGIIIDNFFAALMLSIVWGILNYFLKPVLNVVMIPITLFTFGLFSLVINGALFWFMSTFVKGFHVDGFGSAIVGAFLVYLLTWIGDKVLVKENKD